MEGKQEMLNVRGRTSALAFALALATVATARTAASSHNQADAATIVVKVGRNASNQFADRYNPNSITVNAGDTVRWEWDGDRAHDVTSYSTGLFASPGSKGGMTSTASIYSFTFNTPGTYTYYCQERSNRSEADPAVIDSNLDSRMVGKIVVLAADATGPVASALNASPNPTEGATSVTLTATISDATTGNSNVAAAEYFVNTAGTAGTGTPMTVADGSFNSPTENVTASVNVSALGVGSHTLFVRGRDSAGNWGTTSSTALSVTTSGSGGGGPTATVLLVAGTLANSTNPVAFSNVQLTGATQTSVASPLPWEAVDARGTGAGWNVTLTSTNFSSTAGSIAVANFRVQLLSSRIITLAGAAPPVTQVPSYVALSATTPLKLLSAAAATGMGTYRYTPDFQLTIPASTAPGDYSASLVVSINSGP